jgi:hypothetical protein
MLALMTHRLVLAFAFLVAACASVAAQEPPPRLPFVVVDVHGTFVNFPSTSDLAASRGLTIDQLPGATIGGDLALHIYPLRWRAVTFGIGGRVMGARARQEPASVDTQTFAAAPVTERFLTGAPELSFNFGSGNGWSYISGGIGLANWSILPEGGVPTAADEERLRTVSYGGGAPLDADEERLQTSNFGGGARWFIKKHLAFSFDVRVYGIKAGTFGEFHSPRTSLLVIGAGVSLK